MENTTIPLTEDLQNLSVFESDGSIDNGSDSKKSLAEPVLSVFSKPIDSTLNYTIDNTIVSSSTLPSTSSSSLPSITSCSTSTFHHQDHDDNSSKDNSNKMEPKLVEPVLTVDPSFYDSKNNSSKNNDGKSNGDGSKNGILQEPELSDDDEDEVDELNTSKPPPPTPMGGCLKPAASIQSLWSSDSDEDGEEEKDLNTESTICLPVLKEALLKESKLIEQQQREPSGDIRHNPQMESTLLVTMDPLTDENNNPSKIIDNIKSSTTTTTTTSTSNGNKLNSPVVSDNDEDSDTGKEIKKVGFQLKSPKKNVSNENWYSFEQLNNSKKRKNLSSPVIEKKNNQDTTTSKDSVDKKDDDDEMDEFIPKKQKLETQSKATNLPKTDKKKSSLAKFRPIPIKGLDLDDIESPEQFLVSTKEEKSFDNTSSMSLLDLPSSSPMNMSSSSSISSPAITKLESSPIQKTTIPQTTNRKALLHTLSKNKKVANEDSSNPKSVVTAPTMKSKDKTLPEKKHSNFKQLKETMVLITPLKPSEYTPKKNNDSQKKKKQEYTPQKMTLRVKKPVFLSESEEEESEEESEVDNEDTISEISESDDENTITLPSKRTPKKIETRTPKKKIIPVKKEPIVDTSGSSSSEDDYEEKENIKYPNLPRKKKLTPKKNPKESELFKGFSFLITGISQTEDKDCIYNILPLHSGRIVAPEIFFINSHRQKDEIKDIVLANQHKTTVKYLKAVLYGKTILSVLWVEECIKMNKLLPMDKFKLPSGYSILEKKLVYLNSPTKNILDDCRVELVGSKEFKSEWSAILRLCGARVVNRMVCLNGRIDMVLTDGESIGNILKSYVSQFSIPVITTKWVIQCILDQKKLDITASKAFYMDFNEGDDCSDDE
eukprot:gene7740-9520_t